VRLACAALFFVQAVAFAAAASVCVGAHSKGAAIGTLLVFVNLTGFAFELRQWVMPRPRES
jgi:hypothetical protein